ncbi:MAG: alpha/beta fold hydrolase [Magnetococcales bacterium]|nr:alpha/beta fold hydrolase [Magnetococcales bacterium]NGZ04947.1 alpha/beta fold hydrolase [Magnetococcales bacterium]
MVAESVVLVHGLWLDGTEFKWLDWRLRQDGYRVLTFHYPTVRRGLEENAEALWEFLELRFGPGMKRVAAGSVHLVCHSLGGLVALRMLERHPDAPIGRMVALGTPFQGSLSAQRLARWAGGAWLLGRSLFGALDGQRELRVPEGRQVGVLSGTLPLGLSHLIWGLPAPNDGVVAVAETHLPGAVHATLPVMHVGLVFSRRAAHWVKHFLLTGETAW